MPSYSNKHIGRTIITYNHMSIFKNHKTNLLQFNRLRIPRKFFRMTYKRKLRY